MFDQHRNVIQPWFDLSGLDVTSAEWSASWAALVSAGLADDNGLRLWPTETEEIVGGNTHKADCIRAVLAAGATYAARPSFQEIPGAMQRDPGMGVEVVLALMHKSPDLVGEVLAVAEEDRAAHLVSVAESRVIGVFPAAPAALAALLMPTRVQGQATWPPLVALLLDEATRDEVFAEHVIVTASGATSCMVDYVLLPSRNWLLLRRAGDASTTA